MRWRLLLIGPLTAGCMQDPAVPKIRDEVVLRIAVSRTSIRLGEPDTIRVTATNNFGEPVSIRFPNACQVFAFIRDPRGRIVTPEDGWTCLPVVTTLNLAKDEARTFTFVWTGNNVFAGGLEPSPLPPGEYFATATMQAGDFVVHSPPVRLNLLQ
ncbi:MAG TPA: hypothetical protein VJ717_18985 [Gemmatimonadaceae bacterium]|nr:hypothetical protein [Gemmatimonadaceae bacterium]